MSDNENVAPPTYKGECLGLDVEHSGDGELLYRMCVEDDGNWHRTDMRFHGTWLGELKQIVEQAIAARGEGMSQRAERLEAELKDVTDRIRPLVAEENRIRRELRKQRSVDFIQLHGIKKSHVQVSNSDDLPWFGDAYKFGEWLDANSAKPYAEWNGRIYPTSSLISGRLDKDTPALYEDLPDE